MPETPETAMRPQDVPDELVETLRLDLLNWDEDSKISISRAALAAVLPAHEAMVRAKVAEENETEVERLTKELADTRQAYERTFARLRDIETEDRT